MYKEMGLCKNILHRPRPVRTSQAGKQMCSTVWGPSAAAGQKQTLIDLGSFVENVQNCRQITATHLRSILDAAKSTQMP